MKGAGGSGPGTSDALRSCWPELGQRLISPLKGSPFLPLTRLSVPQGAGA